MLNSSLSDIPVGCDTEDCSSNIRLTQVDTAITPSNNCIIVIWVLSGTIAVGTEQNFEQAGNLVESGYSGRQCEHFHAKAGKTYYIRVTDTSNAFYTMYY